MTITQHLRLNTLRSELALFAKKRDEAKSNGDYSDACYYNRLWEQRLHEIKSNLKIQ